MERFCQPWDSANDLYGNFLVIGFLIVQGLDGVYTYLGIAIWGLGIEANPLVSSAVALAGPSAGLAGAKFVAVFCGMILHLRRVHGVVALLTAFYLAVAVLPWTALFVVASR